MLLFILSGCSEKPSQQEIKSIYIDEIIEKKDVTLENISFKKIPTQITNDSRYCYRAKIYTEESDVIYSIDNPDITSDYLAPDFGLLVSPDELRYDELFGNDLIAEANSQFITDDQLNDYARLAIGYMEKELNIDILPRRIRFDDPVGADGNRVARTEIQVADTAYLAEMTAKQQAKLYIRELGYDYRLVAARNTMFIKLRRRPVRDLLTASFVDPFFANEIINLMPYRIVKKSFSGQCKFRYRNFGGGIAAPGRLWDIYYYNRYYKDQPDIYQIDYETGYTNCVEVPEDIRYITKKVAAITLMNIYGDGKLSAIASRSVSLNSVSESINTTLSATSAAFGARILDYRKEIKSWFAQNRSKYSNTLFGALG